MAQYLVKHRDNFIFTLTNMFLQNHWVSGLCAVSLIPNTRKHNVSGTESISVLRREGGDTSTLLGSLERVNLNHWPETDPVSETLCFLVFGIPDDGQVQKPSDSQCYTPSSAPCRFSVVYTVVSTLQILSGIHRRQHLADSEW
jgi:hypothetical protein